MNRLRLTEALRERGEDMPMTRDEEALRLGKARLTGETFEDPDQQTTGLDLEQTDTDTSPRIAKDRHRRGRDR